MWLLSSDDNVFNGKRLWLRPGSAHLLGRTSAKSTGEGVRVPSYIDHQSVSRKHLLLQVSPTEDGDSGRFFEQSTITATDSSKTGSIVRGEKLKGASKRLDGGHKEYIIQVGNHPAKFKLEWRPVILSFTNIGKGSKQKGTALSAEKEKLETAGVKLTTEYLTNRTTHVVAKKRNTALGLQALLQARWLVTESWVDALAECCRKRGGVEGVSSLEEDFDGNWPKEGQFLVPAGQEPIQRPIDYLKPDPNRGELFAGHIFLFLSQAQYDQLLPVVTAGGGKAVVFEYVRGVTKLEDVASFANELAGKKNARASAPSRSSGLGGVVLVRSQDQDAGPDMENLSLLVDQRTVAQNEFLDAILTQDTSNFRKRLRRSSQDSADEQGEGAEPHSSSIPQPPASSSNAVPLTSQPTICISDSPPKSQQSPSPAHVSFENTAPKFQEISKIEPTYRSRHLITQQRFRGFDDFDPSQIVHDESDSDSDSESHGKEPARGQSSQRTCDQIMDVDKQPKQQSNLEQNAKKHARSEPEVETEEQMYDRLMPAHAKLKRRKTEVIRNGETTQSNLTSKPDSTVNERKRNDIERQEKETKDRKVPSDDDNMKKLRARREAEDEQRRLDEEELQRAHLNEDIKPLVHRIETFELAQHSNSDQEDSRAAQRNQHKAWNGRANFKRFRSNKKHVQDDPSLRPRPRALEVQRKYITLMAVPSKGHGLGDEYWLETGHDRARNRNQQSPIRSQATESQHRQSGHAISTANGTVQLSDAEEESDNQAFRRRLHKSYEEDEEERLVGFIFDDVPSTGSAASSQTLRGAANTSTQRARRSAPSVQLGPHENHMAATAAVAVPPARKAKQTAVPAKRKMATVTVDLDDEDEDPLAFRRKRR